MKKGILKKFLNDKRGSAYILAAFSVVPIFGMMALAVDYTNKDRMVTELETASETVALHIAKRTALDPNTSKDDLIDEGKSLMNTLMKFPIAFQKFAIADNTGEVQIIVDATVDTYFGGIFGIDTMTARAKTQARFGRLNVDVAIAIDNSGSMRHSIDDGKGGTVSKINAAKAASKLLVKTAAASVEDLSNADLRFSIVPWHSHVSLPHSEIRTGASEGDSVDQGTWAEWIDWDGYSEGHFSYLAPYDAGGGPGHGDPYFDFSSDDNPEWDSYKPSELLEKFKNANVLEADEGGVNVQALANLDNIGIVTRKDVFLNTNTAFNGCFEHRHGDYRYSFTAPTTSTMANKSLDSDFDGNSLFVPNMAPDERDWGSDRNNYVKDTGGVSDHTDGYWYNQSNGDDDELDDEYQRVMNSAKYVNIKKNSPDHLWANSDNNPNGSCNTAKVLPLSDDVDGISNNKANGDIADAIDAMDANGFTDQSIGLEWAMHSLTPWVPLNQGGAFDDTQKIMIFMTDGYNQTRNATSYKESYMSFQYPRDDIWDEYSNTPDGDEIADEVNAATKKYCDRIKDLGVKVYYIYFGTPNADATEIKDHCASVPEAAIEATNADQLEAAFEKIGDDIGKLRLTHYTD